MLYPLAGSAKNNYLLLTVSGLALGAMVSFLPLEYFMPFIMVSAGFLISAFLIFTSAREGERGGLLAIFSTALFIRLFLSVSFFLLSFSFNQAALIGMGKIKYTPGFLFYNDSWAYNLNGWYLLRIWLRDAYSFMNMLTFSSTGNVSEYDWVNAFVYFFTGYNPLCLFIMNSLAGAVTVIPLYFLARRIFSKNAAILAASVFALWPSHILWCTQNLKEPISVFFCVFCVWFLFAFKESHKPGYFILFCLSFFLFWKFRMEIAIVVALTVMFSYIVSIKKLKDFLITLSFIAAVYFLFDIFVARYFFSTDVVKHVIDFNILFEKLSVLKQARGAYGATGFLPQSDITTLSGVLQVLPTGVFYMLFKPFPWEFQGGLQFFASIEMLFWYLFLPFFCVGIYKAFKNNWSSVSVLVVFIVLMTLLMALIESNAGTMYRHRSVIWAFNIIFIAGGLAAVMKGANEAKNA